RLGVLVERLHVRVRRRRVDVEVVVLDVLTVVALGAGDAERALLHDRIAAVPERQREAEPPVVVRDPEQPVLPPAIRSRPGVIVREELPGGSAGAVVLADRSPLPLGQVRAPPLPVRPAVARLGQPSFFAGSILLGAPKWPPDPRRSDAPRRSR